MANPVASSVCVILAELVSSEPVIAVVVDEIVYVKIDMPEPPNDANDNVPEPLVFRNWFSYC